MKSNRIVKYVQNLKWYRLLFIIIIYNSKIDIILESSIRIRLNLKNLKTLQMKTILEQKKNIEIYHDLSQRKNISYVKIFVISKIEIKMCIS